MFETEVSEVLQCLAVWVGGAEKVKEPGDHGNTQKSNGNCIPARKNMTYLISIPHPIPTPYQRKESQHSLPELEGPRTQRKRPNTLFCHPSFKAFVNPNDPGMSRPRNQAEQLQGGRADLPAVSQNGGWGWGQKGRIVCQPRRRAQEPPSTWRKGQLEVDKPSKILKCNLVEMRLGMEESDVNRRK